MSQAAKQVAWSQPQILGALASALRGQVRDTSTRVREVRNPSDALTAGRSGAEGQR
jgi:hypothetical protein